MTVGVQVADAERATVQLGLRENWRQFALLVVINAFVGGMVGIGVSSLSREGTR